MIQNLLFFSFIVLPFIGAKAQGDHVATNTLVCLVKELDIQMADHTSRHEYRCITEPDDQTQEPDMAYSIDPINLAGPNMYATIPKVHVSQEGQVHVPAGVSIQYSAQRPPKNNVLASQGGLRRRRGSKPAGRRLTIRTQGTSTVLVLRISSTDSQPSLSAAQLSDRVFGTDGDPINFKSIYNECSYGKLTFNPATGVNIQDGVGEISVSESFSGRSSFELENAITTAANAKFGTLSTNFDHVMYCLPPGTAGSWLAYAYIGWYRSVYNDDWCGYPSALAHELGHNLEMQHSNEDDVEYGDQTGLMGFSYGINDGPEMCFNGPKSSFLGWYSDREITLDSTNFPWVGQLVGVVDYGSSSSTQYLVVKINLESRQGSTIGGLYLMYNRARGINIGTQEKADQVTVTQAESLTETSLSLAGLSSANPTYTFSNYDGNNNNLSIEFCESVTSAIPNYVRVSVSISGQTSLCGQNSIPTNVPTSAPTRGPTSQPSPNPTDKPSPNPTPPPTPSPTPLPSPLPTPPPSPRPTSPPSPNPTSPPVTFPTPPPTSNPTSLPTYRPSPRPTLLPTYRPSPRPTLLPTYRPSPRPTPPAYSPSPRPTPTPTSQPTPSLTTPAPSKGTPGRNLDCPSNTLLFQVSIKTDEFAPENSWELADENGQSIASDGPYDSPNTDYQYEKCIDNSVHTFKILDKYGDGLCCDSGQGSYTVMVGGEEIQSGGDFGQVEEVLILPDCASGTTLFVIELQTDYFASETTWELKTSSGTTVASGDDYESQEDYLKASCVSESECYTFKIFDEWGDGFCCSYGFGNYKVSFDGNEYKSDFSDGKEESLSLGNCASGTIQSASISVTNRNRQRRRKNPALSPSRQAALAAFSGST